MRSLIKISASYIAICLVLLFTNPASSQTFDTISNWDGITQDWVVYGGPSEVVANPYPAGINTSAHCFKVVTIDSQWDNFSYQMPEPVNFDSIPRYRLKVLAPASGGSVTMKFQNSDNSYWHEIEKTPVPGQWSELEFDFSGLLYDNLTTMVIFYDFHGTEPGIVWYFDDILKVTPEPILVESNLPIVIINTYGFPIPDDPKIDAYMGIIDNGYNGPNHPTDPFNSYSGNIGIETRGHSTQMFPKKSYGFETRDISGEDVNVSILGMPAESDWILYAPYTDKSMLRNFVTFDMGHQMEGYCTRTVFCELILNNDYKGVYIMMEKIKKDDNRVDINSLKPEEISGDDLTGGYILAVDWRDDGFSYETDGWLSSPSPSYPNAMDITFQYNYPKPEDMVPQQRTYIKNFVTNAEHALIGTDFSDPETGYHKYFDVPSFVDFMLLNEISKEVDKYRLSQFFYKEKDSDGGKLFAGPPWDFNLGYGNVDYWDPGLDYTGWVYTDVKPVDYSIMYWWKRLMEDSYFRDLARTRWTYLRNSKLTNINIQSSIDSIVSYIDVAKDRNYERWPILGTYVWPNHDWENNTYEDEVDYFEDFLFNRLNWMDYNVPGTILNPWVGISAQNNQIHLNLYGDYFRNHLLTAYHFLLNDAPSGVSVQSVEYINSSECVLTLIGDISAATQLSVTVFEEAINTWEDITSNKLETAGIGQPTSALPTITMYESDKHIHIRCIQPELLPNQAEIFNIGGQSMGTYRLEKAQENILSHQLKPGMYLMNFRTNAGAKVLRFVVLN